MNTSFTKIERICKDVWTEYESSLKTTHVLGGGSYGYVTLMEHPIYLGKYAKKTSSMDLLNYLQKELDIMLRFDSHPCIIRATSPVVHFENNSNGERVCYIYMEYANKRSLEKMIFEEFRGKSIPEYTIQRAARMILQGLEVLHANGYVHGDLKPDNILLFESSTHGEPFDLKLADFGLSKVPNSYPASIRGSMPSGTPLYMPPESFNPNSLIEPSRDIWSLGCVVYEMYGGKATQEISEEYYNWTLVKYIYPVAKDFLRRCHDMQSRRATAAELLNHPFITQKLNSPLLAMGQLADWMVIPKLPGSIW